MIGIMFELVMGAQSGRERACWAPGAGPDVYL